MSQLPAIDSVFLLFVRQVRCARKLTLHVNCKDGEQGSNRQRDAVLQRPAAVLAMKADSDSCEDKQISDIVDKSLEPGCKSRLPEFDPREHAVYFVKESGYKEQQGASYIVGIGSPCKQEGPHNCDQQTTRIIAFGVTRIWVPYCGPRRKLEPALPESLS